MKPLLYLSILFVACGLCGCSSDDDNGNGPDVTVIADLAGDWDCTQYLVTNVNNQAQQFELIALGGSLQVSLAPDGSFVGEASVPDPDTGIPIVLPIGGTFSLDSQTELSVDFLLEFPPLLEDETLEFVLEGNTLTLHDEVTTFDFDDDGVDESAILDVTLVR